MSAMIEERPKRRFSGEDRQRQIIAIAAELFAQKGFNGTTTKEVAEQAGVCEAIIFRHFPSKHDLYSATLEYKATQALENLWLSCAEVMVSNDDQAVFIALATEILETHHKDPALLRLCFYCALEGHALTKAFFERIGRNARARVAEYLQKRIEAGAMRPDIDADLAARSFFSLVVHRAIGKELFQDSHWQTISSQQAAQEITDIFLNGISLRN